MRRLGSWLAVAAVVTLAIVAAADGLRGSPSEPKASAAPPPPPPPAETLPVEERLGLRSEVEQELFLDNARGLLAVADGACSVSVLALPDTRSAAKLEGRTCTLGASRDGRLELSGAAWEPGRDVFARCDVAFVEIRTADGALLERFPGCEPVWRPDGELTYVVLGEVVARRPEGRPVTLLSKSDLAAARLTRWAESYSVRELAWLGDETFAAVVRARGDEGKRRADMVLIFEGRRPVAPPEIVGTDVRTLRPSPRGSAVKAQVDGETRVLGRNGSQIWLPLRPLDALAWSPDERLVAVSWEGEVFFLHTDHLDGSRIRLPVQARDLAWLPAPS